MQTVKFDTPALYGDHHVTEVRKILTAMGGVQQVYASSAFQVVEVDYDENQVSDAEIAATLEAAGYMGAMALPAENGLAVTEQADKSASFFRKTQAYETNRQVVSFGQKVSYSGRPLWNCPGFGLVHQKMED